MFHIVVLATLAMSGPTLAQDSLQVAQSYWSSQGVTGTCVHHETFRVVPVVANGDKSAIGYGNQDMCLVEIQRRFARDQWRYVRFMARGSKSDRKDAIQAAAEVCGAVVHEEGHVLGKEHTSAVTIMSPYIEDWSTVIPAGCYKLARKIVKKQRRR